ncbi:MAG: discoidin domain-containing protein [Planctomycetota bacterium]
MEVRFRSGSLATGKRADASSDVSSGSNHFWADNVVDDNPSTRWMCGLTRNQWLEVDLGEEHEIGRLRIDECAEFGERVCRFRVLYQKDGEWSEILSGTTLGPNFTRSFPPVSARVVRLEIVMASDSPMISELHLFGPEN